MTKQPTLEQMLEMGLHFGHQTFRWHPNMKPYIFGSRDGIYIIDLTKTQEKLADAINFVEQLAREGGMILLVGTKRQASDTIERLGKETELPYISKRWPGGLLTNFPTMKNRIRYLKQLREQVTQKNFGDMTKQEIGILEKKLALLENAFGGLDKLEDLPSALLIVDVVKEKIALKEAQCLRIPVIALVDTNANPEGIDFAIPANDDAKQGVALLLQSMLDAYKAERKQRLAAAPKTEEAIEAVAESELEDVLHQKEVTLAMSEQEEEEKRLAEEKAKKTAGN